MRTAIARSGIAIVTLAGAAFVMGAARAFPDGAPWGAANPAAEQHCASCHFDANPVSDSDAVSIRGLPLQPEADADYELEIVFDDPDIVVGGFQLIAFAPDHDAGTFTSAADNVECIGAAVRSTAPVNGDGRVAWTVTWQAPVAIALPIVFHVAASAANDDGSPFGDRIHYRTYEIPAE